MTFVHKYGASPFDPSNPADRMAEQARRLVIASFLSTASEFDARTGDEVSAIVSGLLVGIVGIMASHIDPSDESHAALRASLHQTIPWAVDMCRSIIGLPPLADA